MESNIQENKNSMLQNFFVTSLQELYWAETHLAQMLNTMSTAATNTQLKEAFIEHMEETEQHRQRLEEVFSQLGIEPRTQPCMGLQGLFDEGWKVIDETEEGSSQRDVALIIAAQKVEHYEIASYGSLITLARTMGQNKVAELLVPTLEEEKEADLTLTTIAEAGINTEASQEKMNA
ncbi:YciE/YciF ferroxidase family protein [Longitalea arenae]|uniref:YciE/YciF ferroxidase family protein n=1 Tax=Longitalea arenae TaxID=2812558 RepID=UPI001967ABB8|nr:ferritin-like domain-containing protein [Longitalea arenae]